MSKEEAEKARAEIKAICAGSPAATAFMLGFAQGTITAGLADAATMAGKETK